MTLRVVMSPRLEICRPLSPMSHQDYPLATRTPRWHSQRRMAAPEDCRTLPCGQALIPFFFQIIRSLYSGRVMFPTGRHQYYIMSLATVQTVAPSLDHQEQKLESGISFWITWGCGGDAVCVLTSAIVWLVTLWHVSLLLHYCIPFSGCCCILPV